MSRTDPNGPPPLPSGMRARPDRTIERRSLASGSKRTPGPSRSDDRPPSRGNVQPAVNPFSTRCVEPGALAYRFPPGQSIARLAARLRDHGGWGEIVGPHGSGKSTLLEMLILEWRATGGAVVTHRLHDGQRRLPHYTAIKGWRADGARMVVVDGYEQLGWTHRWWLKRRARRAGIGLLVTAHRPVGLPHLFDTSADLPTILKLVAHLTTGVANHVYPPDVTASFARRGGNVREILFDLYLLHERRRRSERRIS